MDRAKDQTLSFWTDALASSSPTPGGGGVGAVLGALSVCMSCMVANLTIGKRNYEDFSDECIDIIRESSALKEELLSLIDEDAQAFNHLMSACKSGAKDEDYAAAAKPSVHIVYAVISAIDLLGVLNEKGNRNLLSDVGVGASCAKSALEICRLNILVNIKFIKSQTERKLFIPILNELIPQSIDKAEFIYGSVAERLE